MKRVRDIIMGLLMGVILTTSIAFAASTMIEVSFTDLTYIFHGTEKVPPSGQKGFIYKDTTYVPLRFVAESLGEEVGWDGDTKTIYVGLTPAPVDPRINEVEELNVYIHNVYTKNGETYMTVEEIDWLGLDDVERLNELGLGEEDLPSGYHLDASGVKKEYLVSNKATVRMYDFESLDDNNPWKVESLKEHEFYQMYPYEITISGGVVTEIFQNYIP